MSALDCADVRDVAPEFALGVLDGDVRSDVVTHVDRCATCRTHISELSETADALVLLAPEAEPPPGFERRAYDAMIDSARRRRWRTVKLVAVSVAAATILSVVTVRVIDSSRSSSTSVAASATQTVAMVGANGQRVGQVDVVSDNATMSLDVTVSYALPDGDYRVVLQPADGAKQPLGTVHVIGGQGSWLGTTSMTGEATLALVDNLGHTQCSADLPTT